MSKYNDLMENVVVTEDMKKRILQNIEKELGDDKVTKSNDKEKVSDTVNNKIVSFFRSPTYKTLLSVAAGLLIVAISGIAIKSVIYDSFGRHDSATMSEGAVGGAKTPAQEAFEAPQEAFEASAEEAAMTEEADSGNDPQVIKTTDHVEDYATLTGDNAEYDVVEDIAIDDITVTFRGNGDTVTSAMWYEGEETYAVYYQEPVSKEAMTEAVKEVIAENE
ncbi:hypothetical protein [Butyrivibrio sp. X503]|uniref:hypothetical protein n=1 Tax=Butyrivibrio sp. X503 TaxID=2364878 RepID=UPI0011C22D3F|nr:hypothetical protein [Butyrivibrio sp. X503]